MLDVDHFKMLNDALGHAAGDACLCQIAGILRQFSKRPTDLAARYGGEEFVLVLANTPLAEAVNIANRIRKAVLKLAFSFGGNPGANLGENRQLSISAGVSFAYPLHDGDGTELVEQADRSLYCAKRKGRNRVEAFGDPCAAAVVGANTPEKGPSPVRRLPVRPSGSAV